VPSRAEHWRGGRQSDELITLYTFVKIPADWVF
jgi:hypothetical protein